MLYLQSRTYLCTKSTKNYHTYMIDFGTLYDKHIDNLFAFGSRFTTDREMLKDCIHDVFVKFYTKRDLLVNVSNLESYLYISLRNRINDEFRRNIHICDNEITDITMRPIAEAEEYEHVRTEQLNTLTNNIRRCFSKLSPRQRQIINLYYVEHRKYEDICKIMGINYQSVRNLMHRSISRLREYAVQNY